MIKYRQCDLLNQKDINYIIHQCNCFNTMGGGIAYQIKNRYPKAYLVDKLTESGDITKLGTYTYADIKTEYSFKLQGIYNLYGQYGFGITKVCTDYRAFEKGLRAIYDVLPVDSITGIPFKIGCGLAGGDWDVVLPIIENTFIDKDLIICEYKSM